MIKSHLDSYNKIQLMLRFQNIIEYEKELP